MQYSSIVITLFASLATASPLQKPQFGLCSSAFDTAQSCDVCVDDVANLDCDSPSSSPTSIEDFDKVCAAKGQAAYCCTLPSAGDGLLCIAQ
ncbi:Fungal hydrophobin domain containing protein [Hyaloscypha variabilis]